MTTLGGIYCSVVSTQENLEWGRFASVPLFSYLMGALNMKDKVHISFHYTVNMFHTAQTLN